MTWWEALGLEEGERHPNRISLAFGRAVRGVPPSTDKWQALRDAYEEGLDQADWMGADGGEE